LESKLVLIYTGKSHFATNSNGAMIDNLRKGKNAKNLLKVSPGPEKDTYFMKDLNLTERVFSEEDFRHIYGAYFKIKKISKRSGYTRFDGQNYKRNYLLAYLQKEPV
jgi:hypothetical protein